MGSIGRLVLSAVVGLFVMAALAAYWYGGLAGLSTRDRPVSSIASTPTAGKSGSGATPQEPRPTLAPTVAPTMTRSPVADNTPAPTPAPASSPTVAPTLAPTGTTVSSPTPSPVPVTEAEASGIVDEFFSALSQDDYASAASKGHGEGKRQIQAMVSAVEDAARERGVQPDIEISNLTVDATTESGSGRLVTTSFKAVAFARLGVFRLPITTSDGSATFVVERVDGQPMIVEINSLAGLPGS